LNEFTNPLSIFNSENDEMGAPVPMMISGGTDGMPGDMDDLLASGYEFL